MNKSSADNDKIIKEAQRRKKEKYLIFFLGLIFLILTWVEFNLFEYSDSLPFVHSIFFFGLVNFNIIILLFMMFLIFRNIVKSFVERQSGVFGSTLKSKLIAAFVLFSFIPTLLMFLVSMFYINNSFDKWFSQKISGVLKSSLEVTNAYYMNSKKKNYHFAHQVAEEVANLNQSKNIDSRIKILQKKYALDAIEYYPSLFNKRHIVVDSNSSHLNVPRVSLEFLQKGIKKNIEASMIHHYQDGNLVRVIVPVENGAKGAVVISTFVPLSLISQIGDIQTTYEDFRNQNPLEYPIKSIYIVILIMMTIVILLGATWFGFYLARQLSIPLEALVDATKQVAQGFYKKVKANSGSQEINHLVDSFNAMTGTIEATEKEVREANATLRKALSNLDEQSRYTNVLLTHVSTGVISLDPDNKITVINKHAAELLNLNANEYIGKSFSQVLAEEESSAVTQLFQHFKQFHAMNIEKEVQLSLVNKNIPLQIRWTFLWDEKGQPIGKVFVFDDLTHIMRAQRAAAWTEVAKRIAHEIKNPLTPIKLSAERLQKKFGASIQDPAFRDCTTMIIEQVDDLKSLVNEFSQFARMPQTQPTMNQLNAIIEQAARLFKNTDAKVPITVELDPELPEFLFDADQFKRVITNLLDNAMRAVGSEKNPEIKVSTHYNKALQSAEIKVFDNGEGIPKDLIDRVFEPYMTTKAEGTGLGLAIVKRTVEDHQGFIRALPVSPKGTVIKIEIPLIYANKMKETSKSQNGEDVNV